MLFLLVTLESCAACKVVYGSLSDDGKWIGCDKIRCGRWFHYKCVDVTLTPPSKWFVQTADETLHT